MTIAPEALYVAGGGAPTRRLIDVRSPVEVARGALPGALALPLMSDDERHAVGVRYAEAGQDAALELGWALAGPHLPARTEAWRRALADGPTAVTCWRGGLRSALAVELIDRPDVPRVAGGYKALRALLTRGLAAQLERHVLVVVTGLTGAGKTDVLRALDGLQGVQAVDLEGLARHRGSAFGAEDAPQPSQATFENAVGAALRLAPTGLLVVEDESRWIGRRTLPPALHEAMLRAPRVVLEASDGERVARLYRAYVAEPTARHGADAVRERLLADLGRVRKRLGGARHDAIRASLLAATEAWSDPDAHAPWIAGLLTEYYDPLYLKALARVPRTVWARGDAAALRAFLAARAVEGPTASSPTVG
jgi:tRNA 2-selenouridine synthase